MYTKRLFENTGAPGPVNLTIALLPDALFKTGFLNLYSFGFV